MAVTVSVNSAHRFAKSIVADLVVPAGFVIEANIFTELAVTDLSLRALGVTGADLGLLDAGHGSAGVGDEAGRAGAGGAVVDDLALGVGPAGRAAGVRAPVVDAGVRLGAVLVLPAANQAHLVQADVAQETVIVHPAGQHAEPLQTSLVEGAVLVRGAGRLTDPVTALERVGAVQGAVAGAGDPHTLNLGVPSEVLRTDALLPVSLSTAERVKTAGSLGTAQVSALTSLTDLAILAVPVSGAGT